LLGRASSQPSTPSQRAVGAQRGREATSESPELVLVQQLAQGRRRWSSAGP
jgi:hypothetical protein